MGLIEDAMLNHEMWERTRHLRPVGTVVLKKVPEGTIEGTTVSEVDAVDDKVQVQWPDDAAPRTEDARDLMFRIPFESGATTRTVDPRQDLGEWWEQLAHSEVGPLISKMLEYGGDGRALDLIEIGRALDIATHGYREVQLDDATLSELGIYFYIVGKLARWTAAVSEDRPVSDDTLHDIGIYVRMVQRIRATGGWPQ